MILLSWYTHPLVASFLSLVAVYVSVWAIRTSKNSQKEQADIQRRLVDIEEARDRKEEREKGTADLIAEFVRTERANQSVAPHDFLRISNLGKGTARDIQILMNGESIFDLPFFSVNEPLNYLGRHSSFDYTWSLPRDGPRPPYKIDITWTDDTGTGAYQSELTF